MIQTQNVLHALHSIRRSLDGYDPKKEPSKFVKIYLHPMDARHIVEEFDVNGAKDMKGEPLEPNDPHGAKVEWGCTRKSGNGSICWRGEWADGIYQPYWTTDLSRWMATPERVRLWGQIQFPYPIRDYEQDDKPPEFVRPMGAAPGKVDISKLRCPQGHAITAVNEVAPGWYVCPECKEHLVETKEPNCTSWCGCMGDDPECPVHGNPNQG